MHAYHCSDLNQEREAFANRRLRKLEATKAPHPFRTENVTFFGEEMSETFSEFPARIGNRVVLRGISFHRANRPWILTPVTHIMVGDICFINHITHLFTLYRDEVTVYFRP